MQVSKRQAVLLAGVAMSLSAFGIVQASHADATQSAGAARVDDFMLADQDLLAHQLYRMADDKAVYWGEQTKDEMMATYLRYRWVDETVQLPKRGGAKPAQAAAPATPLMPAGSPAAGR